MMRNKIHVLRFWAKCMFFILIFSSSLKIQAQISDYPYQSVLYRFVKYDSNKINFTRDSSKFFAFFDKMDNLLNKGEGNLNIVHIGGSHVQADIHSGEFRKRLQTFYPGNKGARGFLFPYKMAKTNNPANYFVEYTGNWTVCKNVQTTPCVLGLSGISVTTRDTSTFLKINPNTSNYGNYDYNRVRIFHNTDSTSFSIDYPEVKNVKYAWVSPEGKFTEFVLKQHSDTLRLRFLKTDACQENFTLYGIQFINDDPGITYHSIGVNGASVPSYLKCSLFSSHLKQLKPDLVILSIGVNDAHGPNFSKGNFIYNYERLLEMIRVAAPNTAVMFTTNNDTWFKRKYVNPNNATVRDAMYEMADKHGLAVWDLYSIMGGYGSMQLWEREGLAVSDRIHFTRTGYTLIGDLMFDALLKSYVNHLKKGGY